MAGPKKCHRDLGATPAILSGRMAEITGLGPDGRDDPCPKGPASASPRNGFRGSSGSSKEASRKRGLFTPRWRWAGAGLALGFSPLRCWSCCFAGHQDGAPHSGTLRTHAQVSVRRRTLAGIASFFSLGAFTLPSVCSQRRATPNGQLFHDKYLEYSPRVYLVLRGVYERSKRLLASCQGDSIGDARTHIMTHQNQQMGSMEPRDLVGNMCLPSSQLASEQYFVTYSCVFGGLTASLERGMSGIAMDRTCGCVRVRSKAQGPRMLLSLPLTKLTCVIALNVEELRVVSQIGQWRLQLLPLHRQLRRDCSGAATQKIARPHMAAKGTPLYPPPPLSLPRIGSVLDLINQILDQIRLGKEHFTHVLQRAKFSFAPTIDHSFLSFPHQVV